MNQQVSAIFRHPVKGLRPEALQSGSILAGRGLEGDRAFAFQFLDESVPEELRSADERRAPWMFKSHLAEQHDWPDLARIVPRFDPLTGTLELRVDHGRDAGRSILGRLDVVSERDALAGFVHEFLSHARSYEKARHPRLAPLRLIGHSDRAQRYTDSMSAPVTVGTAATFADLGARCGMEMDPRRFRLNLILEGAAAWEELDWGGRRLRVGGCVLRIGKPLGRCANIDVHPDTGERDAVIYARLKELYGHALTGMRAEVLEPGEIRAGDSWEMLPDRSHSKASPHS